jgi:hypothetical protein
MFRRLSTQRLNPPLHPVKTHCLFAACTLLASALTSSGITITALGVPSTENFNSLANIGTSSALPAGWFNAESGANDNDLYTAGTGSGNAGDTYSFGTAGSTERALGGLFSGSLTPLFGVSITNGTVQPITALDIAYTGELWRLGANGRTDRLEFQYSVNASSLTTGTWTDLDALDFITPDTTGPVSGMTAARDGDAARYRTSLSSSLESLSLAPGATLWLRWNNFDAAGADDGLAVDDFSIAARGASVTTPESGMGTLLTGMLLAGTILLAKALRLRGERQRLVPCPVGPDRDRSLRS